MPQHLAEHSPRHVDDFGLSERFQSCFDYFRAEDGLLRAAEWDVRRQIEVFVHPVTRMNARSIAPRATVGTVNAPYTAPPITIFTVQMSTL
jgi:hypothetical protein